MCNYLILAPEDNIYLSYRQHLTHSSLSIGTPCTIPEKEKKKNRVAMSSAVDPSNSTTNARYCGVENLPSALLNSFLYSVFISEMEKFIGS